MTSMTSIDIRAADPASNIASALMQALHLELNQLSLQEPGQEMDWAAWKTAGGCFAVVGMEGEAIGCGGFCPLDQETAAIQWMFIQPAFRQRGLSRQLLHWLETTAQRRGFTRLQVTIGNQQAAAIHLYHSAGYTETPPFSTEAASATNRWLEKPLSQASPPWQGDLSLTFVRQADKTIPSRSQVQAPLKVQRPFYPEGETVCHSVMLHTAGGIVGGDRLSYQIQLEPDAQVLLTTAAATKIYRSNGLEAQQKTQIQVAAGACLEWLPQEAILFDGALYRQQVQVELEAGATWIGWDVTRLGRSARGERFLSGEWRSRTEIWQAGRLIWIDPQFVQGGSEMLDSLSGLAGCPVIGSLTLIGQPVSEALFEQVQAIELAQPAAGGITRLTTGLLCRYRGASTAEARRWLMAIWQLLRQDCLGRAPCIPRIWQL